MKLRFVLLSIALLMIGTSPSIAKPLPPKPAVEGVSEEARDAAALARTCPSGRWRWNKGIGAAPQVEEFPTPSQPLNAEIDFRGGRLKGVDRGEFGGELWAKHADGREIMISADPVRGVHQMWEGAIVLFGLRHRSSNRGYATHIQAGQTHWPFHLIGMLPGRPDAIADIGYNLFAVRTAPGFVDGKVRVSIMSNYAIMGEASCIREKRRSGGR